MRRLLRQREVFVAVGLSLFALVSPAAAAATKLITDCKEIEKAGAGNSFSKPGSAAPATLICNMRADGFANFESVKARLKGQSEDLEATFEAFEPAATGATTFYLMQVLPNARRTTLSQMADAVATFADQRDSKRRFTAFTFSNELRPIADSGASKNEFVRQVIAVKPASEPIQLYKMALQAIDLLTKESGGRKALVILGDGTSDDTDVSHDQVVLAAKDAGIAIHVLGFYDDRRERPKFQKLSRLAEDTGGYAAEIKQSSAARDFRKDLLTTRFADEVLENGGTVRVALKGAPGPQTIEFTADVAGGTPLQSEVAVNIPPPAPPHEQPRPELWSEPEPAEPGGFGSWLGDNAMLLAVLGAVLGFGVYGFMTYGRQLMATAGPGPEKAGVDARAETTAANTTAADPGGQAERAADRREIVIDAAGDPVVYGWLEMLDGNAIRHPLRTTNVRVGRHRDNDICLQNDSISRRHALLHYNAETRRFVITDLGGGNGVVVNKTKCKSRELSDGDVVELGEVRLRFRTETGLLA